MLQIREVFIPYGPFSLTWKFYTAICSHPAIHNRQYYCNTGSNYYYCFQVDVYSFGVLLCEMCICKLPDPERRNEQVLLMRNDVFRNLVRECLKVVPAERPDMARIIQEFEGCDQTQ